MSIEYFWNFRILAPVDFCSAKLALGVIKNFSLITKQINKAPLSFKNKDAGIFDLIFFNMLIKQLVNSQISSISDINGHPAALAR